MTDIRTRGKTRPGQPLRPQPDRERVITAMLNRYHEFDGAAGTNISDQHQDRILTRQHDTSCAWLNTHGSTATAGRSCDCWIAAMDELTRCLETMRKLRKQRAIAYTDKRGGHHTDDIGTIYQHVIWWYVDCRYRSIPATKTAKKKGKKTASFVYDRQSGNQVMRLIPVRHPDARQEKAEAGVRFLAHLFRGSPKLPGSAIGHLRAVS